jgi:hypothetical protein
MSLLLDLLNDTYNLHKKMEDARTGSLLSKFIWTPFTFNAPTLKSLYDTHLQSIMTSDSPAAQDSALATAILELKYPGTENKSNTAPNASDTSSTVTELKDEAPAEEVLKEKAPKKKKFDILADILKACANLANGHLNKEATLQAINELTPLLQEEFSHLDGVDLYIFKVHEFVRIMADLKENQFLRSRFIETEAECGKKTTKIAGLEADQLQANAAFLKMKADYQKSLDTQNDNETEIVTLKEKIFRPMAHTKPSDAPDIIATLDTLKKLRHDIRIIQNEKQLLEKQAQEKIAALQAELLAEQNKNLSFGKMRTAASVKQVMQTSSSSPTQSFRIPPGVTLNHGPRLFNSRSLMSSTFSAVANALSPSTISTAQPLTVLESMQSTTNNSSSSTPPTLPPKPGSRGSSYQQ